MAESMINSVKNKTIKFYLNNKFSRIGTVLDLHLDSKNKTLKLNVLLVGEEKPLQININNYQILNDENTHFIQIDNVSTSKEWLNIIADEFLQGYKFEIGNTLGKLVKVVV